MKLTLKEIDVISYAVEIMSLFKEVDELYKSYAHIIEY